MKCLITYSLSTITVLLSVASNAFAADVFVMRAQGSDLTNGQALKITDMVKRAIRRLPDHTLVTTQDQAELTLKPTLINRNDEHVLRIEKFRGSDLLAMSEQPLASIDESRDQVRVATDTALMEDRILSGMDPMTDSMMPGRGTPADPLNDALIDPDNGSESAMSGSASDSSASYGGDLRGPSPAVSADRTGAFQFGVGPAFGLGMNSDNLMYNVNLGYVHPIDSRLSVKGFGDLNFATGADDARFLNFALGGEYLPTLNRMLGGLPYVNADVGFAFARDNDDRSTNAPALGAGAGFRFAAEELNVDLNLHYTVLTARLDDNVPSVLGLRAALNF